jgi:hypothetical protein
LEELPDSKVFPEGKRRAVDKRASWHSYSRDSPPCFRTEGQVLFEFIRICEYSLPLDQIIEQLDFSFQYAFQKSASEKRVRAACTRAQKTNPVI